MTKKRSSEILREEYKIFSRASKNLVSSGHPTACARHCSNYELIFTFSKTEDHQGNRSAIKRYRGSMVVVRTGTVWGCLRSIGSPIQVVRPTTEKERVCLHAA